jgi:hypothetical protein
LVVLDSALHEILRLDLQAEPQHRYHAAMSPDGLWLGLSARTELRVVNRRGMVFHRFPHNAWESFTGSNCFFDAKCRLWYVQPGDQPGVDDRLSILNPGSGERIAERTIRNPVGLFYLFPCPDQESVLVDVGCGQDGSYLYLARLDGAELTLAEYPFDDRTFSGGFSLDGREFVTGAHAGDALMVHSFPNGHVVASIESETLFAADDLSGETTDDVGYQAIFLDDDHLLAQTGFGRLVLLDRRSMRLLGTVWPTGCRLRGYDEHGEETDDPIQTVSYETGLCSLHPAGPGKVLTVYDQTTVRLLDVSPLLSLP